MKIGDWLDVVLLIILLLIGVAEYSYLSIAFQDPIVATTEDKSAIDTNNQIFVDNSIKTGSDLFMSLVVTDEYNPFPKSIRINDTPVIDLDKIWVADKYSNLNSIYNVNGTYKLGSMLDWKITDTEYVYNDGDPYIQYTLEED